MRLTSPIAKGIEKLCHRHQGWRVFADFVEMGAICYATLDLQRRDAREARYLQIVKGYEADELVQLARLLGELVLLMEAEPADHLGRAFQELDLGNHWHGQFFTPQPLADMMARMVMGDAKLPECGFLRLCEPAVGAGAMVIGACKAARAAGINYQREIHVTAIDLDPTAAHMAFIQLSLLHVPAVVLIGNTISQEMRETWYTPAHIMGFWSAKLKRERGEGRAALVLTPPPSELEPANV